MLYVAVSLVLTGLVPYRQLGVPHPIALGVEATGQRWLETFVEVGAIAGLSSVMLVMLMGQPRIFFSMAHDGLLPPAAARVHPRFGTPWITTIITGVAVMLARRRAARRRAGPAHVGRNAVRVRAGQPGRADPAAAPARHPARLPRAGRHVLVPICGAGTSAYLMLQETGGTLIRLFGWMAIGLAIYFRLQPQTLQYYAASVMAVV